MKSLTRAIVRVTGVGCGSTLLSLGSPCVAPIALAQAAAEPAPDGDARVESDDRGGVASVEILGCRASLEYRSDSTSLDYANGCPQSTAAKAAVLDALLRALFGEAGVPSSVTVLRTGWMKRFSEDLSRRIAWHANVSAEWRSALAKRSEMGPGDHGLVSVFVARLIDDEGFYREIRQTLRNHRSIVVSARVEKPFVGLPSMTPSEDWLLEHGVAADQLLPLDAIVSFALAPASDPSPHDSPDAPDESPPPGPPLR